MKNESLFKGHNTAPLSQDEIVKLYQKFRLITPQGNAQEKKSSLIS